MECKINHCIIIFVRFIQIVHNLIHTHSENQFLDRVVKWKFYLLQVIWLESRTQLSLAYLNLSARVHHWYIQTCTVFIHVNADTHTFIASHRATEWRLMYNTSPFIFRAESTRTLIDKAPMMKYSHIMTRHSNPVWQSRESQNSTLGTDTQTVATMDSLVTHRKCTDQY